MSSLCPIVRRDPVGRWPRPRKLLARDADVDFQGIGSVQIYASGKLDAKVNGMGN